MTETTEESFDELHEHIVDLEIELDHAQQEVSDLADEIADLKSLLSKSEEENKELEEKLSLYEWKDIKDAPRDRLVLVDSSNITNRRAGENVALASWFYYDGLACWRDDNNEKIEPQPYRYVEFTPPTQEAEE